MSRLAAIAAVGCNRELGLQGDMPWKRALSQDLRFFKEKTLNHPMLMGRRTFESLPGLLPGRPHLVVGRTPLEKRDNLFVYPSIEEALADWQEKSETIFVIGGGQMYAQLIDRCDELYLTEIESSFDADTYFPDFDPSQYERTVLDTIEENGFVYHHVHYQKR